MSRIAARVRRLVVLTACMLTMAPACLVAEADPPKPSPAQLRAAVVRFFAEQPDYQAGDLITRSQAKSLLDVLEGMGFQPDDAVEILARVPADGDYLVAVLHAPAGRRFMRQVSSFPGGYDRLDHLSRMPHGRQTIEDLIHGPDGYKMIEYMTAAPGGRALGKMLSRGPDKVPFNKPTGRIYTAEALWQSLERSYRRASAP
jgi:hypothetical protein